MILTVPTDANGGSTGQGARFIGMELTSTTEIFNFRATNGFADVQPLPLDTDADGIMTDYVGRHGIPFHLGL